MAKAHIMIMAGGTGGHIFPALAVARDLQQQDYSISWLGTPKRMEADLIPNYQIPIDFIDITGLRGKSRWSLITAPWRLLVAIWQACRICKRVKPDVVLGMGGFAAGPGAVAAKLLGIPLVIHEQNAIAGVTNRLSARLACRVFAAFPNTFANGIKANCVGNPVRAALMHLPLPKQRLAKRAAPWRVLILGGSLGALALNTLVPQALAQLSMPLSIRHQCGGGHESLTKANYQQQQLSATVSAFIDDMAEAYAWADVVICRAGALTIAELCAVGVASILIPFPHAVDDHQTKNGQYLVNAGAAKLYQQAELKPERLAADLSELLENPASLLTMAQQARTLATPNAATAISQAIVETIHATSRTTS